MNKLEEDIAKANTYIELVLKKDYCNCNELNTNLGKHCDGSKNVAYAMQHILSDYKRVLKENEELNNRCKNLDEEAQAYVEELMGDSTLKDRIINRLNKENEELKASDSSNSKIIANMSTRHFQDREKIRNSIPIQKIKDIIDRIDYDIKKTKEIISNNSNIYASYRKNDYQIVRLRAMNTKSLDIKKRLQELLESEE